MKKKKAKQEVTHEDIKRALENFSKSGGLIKKLPDEYAPSRVMPEGTGVYENVAEFLAKVDHTG